MKAVGRTSVRAASTPFVSLRHVTCVPDSIGR